MTENNNIISKYKMERKKDQIRDYYNVRDNKLYCTIENYTKSFSNKTSILSLKYHIYNFHKINKNLIRIFNNLYLLRL